MKVATLPFQPQRVVKPLVPKERQGARELLSLVRGLTLMMRKTLLPLPKLMVRSLFSQLCTLRTLNYLPRMVEKPLWEIIQALV
jgi:hypothetical protein